MFVYNVTTKVDKEILVEWINWFKNEHLPEIMATELFDDSKFFELLEPGDIEASTFVLQCFTESKEKYNTYINEHSPAIIKKSLQKWGDNFISFKTLLQTVQ